MWQPLLIVCYLYIPNHCSGISDFFGSLYIPHHYTEISDFYDSLYIPLPYFGIYDSSCSA